MLMMRVAHKLKATTKFPVHIVASIRQDSKYKNSNEKAILTFNMIQCYNQSSQQKEYANRQMHGRPVIIQKSFIFALFLFLRLRRAKPRRREALLPSAHF